MISGIPLPDRENPIDQPFWQGAAEGQLLVQQCKNCLQWHFPARAMCSHCQSTELLWQPVSGKGRLWSYTTCHPPLLPAFMPLAPYTIGVIELLEGANLRMVGNLLLNVDSEINEVTEKHLTIGMPVNVTFQQVEDDLWLPRWVLEKE